MYPNEYALGMANLGYQVLIEQLSRSGVDLERYFLPSAKMLAEHQRSATPILGLERLRPLAQAEIIFFSVAFEPDYVGLVELLQLSGIAPLAEDRDHAAPLVIAGGIAPTINPEPIAAFCDLIGVGEAEVLLPPLMEAVAQQLSKEELIQVGAHTLGWYVPSQQQGQVVRQHAPLEQPCYPAILSSQSPFSHHLDVEICRGCRWRCRFCAAGHVVTPYRELDLEALLPALDWGLEQRGKIGLVGTDVSDHSQLETIVDYVRGRGGEIAFPSLRVEALARSSGAAARIINGGPPRTLTMAVEAASESLRRALGKRLSLQKILRAAELAAQAGVANLRIYLLVGVPGEQWQEIEDIVELSRELLRVGPGGELTLSINGLVPKAGTPLQWEPAPDRKYLKKIRAYLRRTLPRSRVKLLFDSPDWIRWQTLLSVGDREVSRYLLQAADAGWRAALAQASRREPILLGEGRPLNLSLPWQHIIRGSSAQLLLEEHQRCVQREYIPPARLTDG